jgi:hypothetical protein
MWCELKGEQYCRHCTGYKHMYDSRELAARANHISQFDTCSILPFDAKLNIQHSILDTPEYPSKKYHCNN